MRLIGSLTEQNITRELLQWNRAINENSHQPVIADSLRKMGADLCQCFLLHWIPEQAEDIYVILISEYEAVTLEVSRVMEQPPVVDAFDLASYEKHGSPLVRLRLTIARQLQHR